MCRNTTHWQGSFVLEIFQQKKLINLKINKKMKKLTTVIMMIAVIAISVSCKKDLVGNGPVTTQARTVTSFTGIDLRMNGDVYYKNDTAWKVEISAKESIHSMLETKVENNRLVIRYSNGRTYDADESIRINVSGPGVSSFALNTSGSIFCTNDIQTANLYLSTTGSGNISLQKVTANSIVAISGQSGRISATYGTAVNEDLKTDGSGKIDISAIASKNVTARTNGSGDIKVKVSDHLDATIDGSGSIYFDGYPVLTSHVAGTGKIIRF
jgi:Putative auto-transporter adhesin, head GIN domain